MMSDQHRLAVCSAVARILREERLKRGLSLSAVASKAGLSHQMVSFIEKETRNPTLDTLLRVCNAIGIELTAVLRRADRRQRPVRQD